MKKRKLQLRKTFALVAHDKKKDELVNWADFNKEILLKHDIVATGTTGKLLEEKLGRDVTKLLSGPLGGDQQIGGMIAEGKVDVLIFFWDPMEAQPHDSDVKAVLRLAVAWNILIAMNKTTADFIVTSSAMAEEYTLEIPDYSRF